ncbi:EAL domain-containing protein [Thiomicrorhabdus sp. Milos-T2]|uniref:bifunctional diguanylate cyclase/phosphodiesterase n=1 Tax=Thiomicrorhabdus sp. Milos-T2 TaxID=90814 RepID=UPI00068F3ED0|nr:EAL domain-containing protein [Thiomicrorhabdus sp. Milos-T2]
MPILTLDKEYDVYLVLGSLLISFLTSFLAIAFASFIVWHKKNTSNWWLMGASVNMGLGVWAMHFVGMLALHLDVPFAFEPIRTIISALIAVLASYGAFWVLLSEDFNTKKQRQLYGTFVLGSGVAAMHYLGMDAMQMFPKIQYDTALLLLSLIIAYSASYIGLSLFIKASNKISHHLFSKENLVSSLVIGLAVSGMHYSGMAAAQFNYNSYCTVLEQGVGAGSLSIMVVIAIVVMLLVSFLLIAYEQYAEAQENEQNRLMLQMVTMEVEKRANELQQQTSMNQRLLETMDAIVVVLNPHGVIEQFNLAAQKITGYDFKEVVGSKLWDKLIPEADIEKSKLAFKGFTLDEQSNKHQNQLLTKQGSLVAIDWHNSILHDKHGNIEFIIATGIDITQRLKDQEALRLSSVAFETQEAVVVTDNQGVILRINKAFQAITGYSESEVVGLRMSVLKSGKHSDVFYKKLWKTVAENGCWQGEIWNRKKNGDIFPEWLRITQVLDNNQNVTNYIGSFSDITQRKKIEDELQFLAFYDAITELPNRRLFNDRLEQNLQCHKKEHHHLAVVFIDLDNFKQINDTFGHAFGDKLLVQFSQLIKNMMSDSVTVSRFGGDEFVMLFPELADKIEAAIFQVENIVKLLLEELTKGLAVDEHHVHVSCSIGIAVSDSSNDSVSSLLMQADSAMYQAKSMGKNTFRFYTDSLGESMAERFKMEVALRHDLYQVDSGESPFFVVYQPQYNRDMQMIGAEALVRWNSKEFGLVSPFYFITIAEESELIDKLGMFVVEQVLNDINHMDALFSYSTLKHISINLSIKQLTNPNLTSRLLSLFQENKVAPNKVRFEFTESAFLDNALDPKALFAEMSEIGFTFALDDFGTGFSSLSYLKDLPISELKIDKSFVDGIPADESDMTICSATISMAKKLGLELVAEGVETQEQFDWLVSHDCDLLQGYLMSKPISYEEFIAVLKENSFYD